MKVLFINSVCGSSTGRIAVNLAKSLKSKGNDVLMCYGRWGKPDNIESYKISNTLNVLFDGLKSRIFDNAGFNSKFVTKKLIKRIEEFQPDVIHLHNIHGYYLNIEILFRYLKSYKGKIIWTLHDAWCFTGHCAYYNIRKCQKWKYSCNKCPAKHDYPKALFIDRSKKNYLAKQELFLGLKNLIFVSPSKWLADEFRSSFLSCYPVYVVNNGIDIKTFVNKNIEKKYDILFAANVWDERKGLKILNNILSLLIKQNLKIVVIGKMSKKYKLKSVTYIDRVNNASEMSTIYNESKVFLNPTQDENFPTVNLEAQCCGVPVVTFDSGGSKETLFLEDSTFIPCNAYNQMVNKTLEIINKSKKRKQTCIDKYSVDTFISKMLPFYNN